MISSSSCLNEAVREVRAKKSSRASSRPVGVGCWELADRVHIQLAWSNLGHLGSPTAIIALQIEHQLVMRAQIPGSVAMRSYLFLVLGSVTIRLVSARTGRAGSVVSATAEATAVRAAATAARVAGSAA